MKFINCHLLHWSMASGKVPAIVEHVHSYYQIEFCIGGEIKFFSGGSKFKLKSNEWMLIPPGTPHAMVYEGRNLKYYSFKFEINNFFEHPEKRLFFQGVTPLNNFLADTLATLHPADKDLFLPINENRPVLEALLLSMVQQTLSPVDSKSDSQPELLSDLANLTADSGAMLNVQSAAELMNMSVSQLKYRYKKVAPEYAPTIKDFIDRELMRQIDRFLFYSNLSLGEIASQTAFGNIYTFSRFVKRLTGESPGLRRQRKVNKILIPNRTQEQEKNANSTEKCD